MLFALKIKRKFKIKFQLNSHEFCIKLYFLLRISPFAKDIVKLSSKLK